MRGDHLRRDAVVNSIIAAARSRQFVVVGAPPATGKTSLLQLVENNLRQKHGATVHRLHLKDTGETHLLERLKNKGIEEDRLDDLENCWLILDDAQNVYDDEKYSNFWQFIVKAIGSSNVDDKLFVIIAATYDYGTTGSPVQFKDLVHVHADITLEEASELFTMHAAVWGYQGWETYLDALLSISSLSSGDHHVGVVVAGIRLLEEARKRPGQGGLDESAALSILRSNYFIGKLDRCFQLPNTLPLESHDLILDVLLEPDSDLLPDSEVLDGLIRMGILTQTGNYSCHAANWYYNRKCFPNRSMHTPATLDDLVKLAVSSLSAKRLRDTLVDGFPKEAAFQHLFNEGLSLQLPTTNFIIPELNTYATDASGNIVTGELDFYINGALQWCLELLRQGDKIGEHLDRFDKANGKYREVASNDYLVVDCRGPKHGPGVQPKQSRCTLYFSKDFSTCICKMRCEDEITLTLSP
eukprot:CAMPEP_0168717728 /NCGR_PEP_ID=MMETSP0724-20121128/149_1 /TAXON_ID=265536 /ORGANISM="Amphiprora sp., Strain CCMP467" /LENGTH=468 /DNA_ID=CAMNT_0008764213 /DNA_START=9 /DNA_END=1415 /DNA_ORIENTATION=+